MWPNRPQKTQLDYSDYPRINSKTRLEGLELDIVYQIGHVLYLNITNRCTSACSFCVRFKTDSLRGYHLKLTQEPTVEEVKAAIGDPTRYREIVFCGYGEPLLRLPEVIAISKYVKEKKIPTRLNTNGHGNLIYRRNIVVEIAPFIDAVSISLNAENEEKYMRLCRPAFGAGTYEKVKEFIRECKKYIPRVVVTAVAIPEIDLKKLAEVVNQELGVELKLRHYDDIILDDAYGKSAKK